MKRPFNALLYFAVACGFSSLTLLPLFQGGWPLNHEHDSFANRTIIFAQHAAAGDVLPVWSTLDNAGFGSPQPALYHKLSSIVTGILFLMTGNLKHSLMLGIVMFLVAGATGMRLLLRRIGVSARVASAGGLMLICANYTVTNWLIRGAMAEFAAAMIIPWALSYFIVFMNTGVLRPGLAISLSLVFLAHSVLCFYLVMLLAAAAIIVKAKPAMAKNGTALRSAIVSLAVAACLAAPFLAAMAAFASDYDMGRMLPYSYQPWHNFKPLVRYVWDGGWTWGETWSRFTVQLDLPILACVMLGSAGLWRGSRANVVTPLRPLMLIGIIIIALQTGISSPFYKYFPGAVYIQFPWRLLSVLTPVAIAAAMFCVENAFRPSVARGITAACMVWMAVSSGAFAPIHYERMERLGYTFTDLSFSAFGEFIPRNAGEDMNLLRGRVDSLAATTGYTVAKEQDVLQETMKTRFHVVRANAGSVTLPVFYSPYHGVASASDNGERGDLCRESGVVPGLLSVDCPAGVSEIDVRTPTLWRIIVHHARRIAGTGSGRSWI